MTKKIETAAANNASSGSTVESYNFRPYEDTSEVAERIARRAIKAGKETLKEPKRKGKW